MSDIVEVKPSERLPAARTDFGAIVQAAVDKGIDATGLSKLLDVFERVKAADAKEAFAAAMTEFKSRCPQIERRTENPQFTVMVDGRKVPRKFASLQDIGAQTKGLLSECGLSYRWGDAVVAGSMMTISCIVRHVGGHEESSSSTIPIESSAGASPQQKFGIAEAYAMRYSLKKALGLTDTDEDTDGNLPETVGPCITEEQAITLDDMLAAIGPDAKARFLKSVGRASLSEIPAAEYAKSHAAIKKRLDEKGGKS